MTAASGDRRQIPTRLIVVLGALTAISTLATDIYLPAMPAMAEFYSADAVWIQATLSAFIIGMAVGQLCLGPLSDTVGRRRLLIAGTVVSLISTALVALAPSVEVMLVWRVLQGMGSAAGVVIGRAIVSDLADDRGAARAFSVLGLIGGIGPIVGPPVGAAVLTWAPWPAIFWSLAGLCLLTLVTVIVLVPESLPREHRLRGGFAGLARVTATLVRTPTYLSSALMMCMAVGGVFAYIAASPFVIQTILGFDPFEYTIAFAVNGVGLTVAGAVAARLAGPSCTPTALCRVGLTMLTTGGAVLVAASIGGFFVPWVVLPALFVVPTGMGLVFGPGTALVVMGARSVAGTALAILGCGQFLAGGITSPLAGIGGETASLPVSVTILATGALALACLRWFTVAQRRLAVPSPDLQPVKAE